MAVDFKELLAKPLDDVKAPPLAPAGTYFGTIKAFKFNQSRFENEETGDRNWQARFTVVNIEAGPDILALPGAMDGIDLTSRTMYAELPLEGGNEYVTKQFLEECGIETTGRGFGETIPLAVGQAVMFDGVHTPNKKDPSKPAFFNVRNLRKRPD
jgi:hypothetical protein